MDWKDADLYLRRYTGAQVFCRVLLFAGSEALLAGRSLPVFPAKEVSEPETLRDTIL